MSWWYDDPEEVERRTQESFERDEKKFNDFREKKAAERRANPGYYERRVAAVFSRHGIPFEQEKNMHSYIADFFLPVMNRVVEIDGGHHYADPEQRQSDSKRDAHFLRKGISTTRIPNREVGSVERLSKEALLRRLTRDA